MSYVPPGGQPPMGYPMQPPPPKKKSKAGLIVAAVIGVMLFLCCGGFSVWALATADDRAKPTSGADAGADPTTPPTPSREKDGASKAKIGQCINVYSLPAPTPTATPTAETSQVVTATERVPCGTPGGYQVLKRFDATTSGSVCSAVTGATSQYVADQSLSTSEDFVLCLKKQ